MDGDTHTNESNQVHDPAAPGASAAEHNPAAERATPHAEPAAASMAAGAASANSIKGEYKVFGILGYLIPILFFLPLLQDHMKHDPYVRFHVNQQLILLVTVVIVWFVGDYILIMLIGFLGYILMQLVRLALLVMVIIGIINVVKGEQKELPLIGGFTLMQ